MDLVVWLQEHWLDVLQSIGIVGGLLFTAVSLRVDSKVRRVGNLLLITSHHREIWTRIIQRPELSRVLRRELDLNREPVTPPEQVFVLSVILHLRAVREAAKQELFSEPEQLKKDVRWFLSLSIPSTVWEQVKSVQDAEFVRFIDEILGTDHRKS